MSQDQAQDGTIVYHINNAKNVFVGKTTQNTQAETVAQDNAKVDLKSENCSTHIASYGNSICDEEKNGTRSEEGQETETPPRELNAEPMEAPAKEVTKRNASEELGPESKIQKIEPDLRMDTDPVEIDLAIEHAETLMRKNKFSDAHTALTKIGSTHGAGFRFKHILAQCKLRLGYNDATKQAIEDLAEFIHTKSNITWERVLDIGTKFLKPEFLGKAMVIFASYALVLAKKANLKDSHDAAFRIANCIKSFSDAVRKIPDTKRKKRKNARKSEPTLPALEKRFGPWYNSLEAICPVMDMMLDNLRSLAGSRGIKTAKKEAYALNWMSSAAYYIQKRDKGVAYSREGVNISENSCGQDHRKEQFYAELLHNLGRGTAMCGNVPAGLDFLKKSLALKKSEVTFDSEDKKEDSIKATENCKGHWESVKS